ncbi:MAG: C13 family peptidase, partial [Pseudomonadota bacterium]
TEAGKFDSPFGIAADKEGNIFVADTNNNRIQKFSPEGTFAAAAGEPGRYPNQMSFPGAIALSAANKLFVCDTDNNRIQVFKTLLSSINKKAVIVAGGGPYKGNYLWDATQTCANLAYRSLTFQGFSKETIYYLMSNTYQDLDNNGKFDDIDSDATGADLEYAITDWASSAEDVIIYLTDHGGDAVFRVSEKETLEAAKIAAWIDRLQEVMPGKVVVVYDACRSGSFMPALASFGKKERIVITSASENEEAYFLNSGAVSFSFFFWGFILNGASLYEAFLSARDSMQAYQTALLDDNGNGIGNEERLDGSLARNYSVGNGVVTAGDIPVIQAISSEQTLQGESSAKIWVSGIVDADAIVRTWGVVLPPDEKPLSGAQEEVTDLPTFELEKIDGQQYEAEYEGFKSSGTYKISVYTMDEEGNTSLPIQTEVTQTQGVPSCPVFLLAGGNDDQVDLFRKFRDDILQKSAIGNLCINLFYDHAAELTLILAKNPAIFAHAGNNMAVLAKSFKAFRECGDFLLPDNFEKELRSLAALISAKAGTGLKNDIAVLQKIFIRKSIVTILDDRAA